METIKSYLEEHAEIPENTRVKDCWRDRFRLPPPAGGGGGDDVGLEDGLEDGASRKARMGPSKMKRRGSKISR
eukprot:2675528-Pyramimonas_sp.AAC.1